MRNSKNYFADILMGWFPFQIVLISVPLAIYSNNMLEFAYDGRILIPFIFVSALFLSVLMVVRFYYESGYKAFLKYLFFIGLFFMLSDIFAAPNWGLIDGENNFNESPQKTFIQVILFLILLAVSIKINFDSISGYVFPAIIVITLFTIFQILTLIMYQGLGNDNKNVPFSIKKKQARTGNIYHFVFDAYSSSRFLEDVQDVNAADDLTDFIFFQDNFANYLGTDSSVPSYLQGKFFKGGNYGSFQNEARKGGVRRTLQDNGYRISVYIPDRTRYWMYEYADYISTSREVSEVSPFLDHFTSLAQIVIVRVMPDFLRGEALEVFNKLFPYISYSQYKSVSLPLIDQFFKDEKNRQPNGEYIYLHVIFPHSPYVLDENCEKLKDTKSNYRSQHKCATIQIARIIKQLKSIGHYDNSLIIFQSDHGYSEGGGGLSSLLSNMPKEMKNYIDVCEPKFQLEDSMQRSRALLLVKPFGNSREKMEISNVATQLVDVPASIYDVLGIAQETDGTSFLGEVHDKKAVNLFLGASQLSSKNWGDAVKFCHVQYHQGSWLLKGDIIGEK